VGKRALIIVGFLLAILILAELLSLLQLRASLTTNAEYWQQRSSEPGELTYVALGDSTAQGIGARQPDKGYVGVLADRLATKTGKSIRVVNLSVSGARIRDVIDKQIPQLKDYSPDFITIEAGANDVVKYDAKKFANDFQELAELIPPNTVVANMPYFGGRISRDTQIKSANGIVAESAIKNDLLVVDLYTYTKVGDTPFNYAADLFHPSNRGYRNWADAFWTKLKDL
jgi:lysophospholipase L1-like esterase